MPQLSPVSWVSVFFFLVGMVVNMSTINWWYGENYYEVGLVKVETEVIRSRLFSWGNHFNSV
nr:ATP synthase F0 subunit 8 [Cuneopsis celtiformis]